MINKQKVLVILNDLAETHRGRVNAYEAGASMLTEHDVLLRTLCYQLAEESGEMTRELVERAESHFGKIDGLQPGELAKWYNDNDAKKELFATVKPGNKLAVLKACAWAEERLQVMYEKALVDEDAFPHHVVQLLKDQKTLLRMSLDLVRNQIADHEDNS